MECAGAMERSQDGPEIRPLPALLINQIAAGEVIERPASVVKELVENALDAGATRIVVELERGGIELIRVSDDGRGIAEAQLPLALAQHATSKIAESSDLDGIGTLGFRGEALASIASVSRMSVRSRTAERSGAAEIRCEGGEPTAVRPASGPIGTCVTVRNLFFNTPARRKFLRTPGTEQARCRDWLQDLALARPAVGFTLACDGRKVLELAPDQGPRRRALELLGRELDGQLLEATLDEHDDSRGVTIWGLVGLPSIARATAKAQHVFINGRAVRDRTIQHAIREAYRGLIEPGRHPTAVLMLEMDPTSVDVNVHPAKLEVRFRDQSMVHSAVLRAVREALRREDLTPRVPERGPSPGDLAILPVSAESRGAPSVPVDRFVEYFQRQAPDAIERLDLGELREALRESEDERGASGQGGVGRADAPMLDVSPSSRALQVHNQYLVTQDGQGLLIVDQHALHERIMFERLLERVNTQSLERQRLLTPAVVETPAERVARLEDLGELLGTIGVSVEPLGPRTLGVQEFPTLLFDRGVDPAAFVADLLELLDAESISPQSEEALHEVLDMMACKAAIRAGDALEDSEIAELLGQRERVERSSNCPHGRPTSIRLTIQQLDRMFGRS